MFPYWVLHGFWINARGHNFTKMYFEEHTAYDGLEYRDAITEDVKCAKKLNIIWPSLTEGIIEHITILKNISELTLSDDFIRKIKSRLST